LNGRYEDEMRELAATHLLAERKLFVCSQLLQEAEIENAR